MTSFGPLGQLLMSAIGFINFILLPLIMALAFLMFMWGVFQYFIAGGANEEKRQQGKDFVLWSVIAFFIIFSLWGIVNLLMSSFGFHSQIRPPLPSFQTGHTAAPTNGNAFVGPGTAQGGSGASVNGGTAINGPAADYADCTTSRGCQSPDFSCQEDAGAFTGTFICKPTSDASADTQGDSSSTSILGSRCDARDHGSCNHPDYICQSVSNLSVEGTCNYHPNWQADTGS